MIYSVSNFGYEGQLITVECDVREGTHSLDIVGITDSYVKQTRERLKSAMRNALGISVDKRILVSLAPADLKKEGWHFDLPIALSIISALKEIKTDKVVALGELEISGKLRPVKGVYSALVCAKENGITKAIVPVGNENDIPDGMKFVTAKNLQEALRYLRINRFNTKQDCFAEQSLFEPFDEEDSLDRVQGFASGKFAMAVAAAGKFNLMFSGSPGCGKTMLLQRFGQLLPRMNKEEENEVRRIKSLAGFTTKENEKRPFRMPHQTASLEGICGGGVHCNPGEISLAHNGVLFLDEAAEFKTSVLQMLRVPLESKQITLSRAGRHTVFPANFQLLIATNPCPCGNFGSENRICLCSASSIKSYWNKFSAPLLDRIQIRVKLEKESVDFSLEALRKMITSAIRVAKERGGYVSELQTSDKCFDANWGLIKDFNYRKQENIKRIARVIADMHEQQNIEDSDIKDAIKLCGETPLERI